MSKLVKVDDETYTELKSRKVDTGVEMSMQIRRLVFPPKGAKK